MNEKTIIKRYLAIDWGKKKLGIALSDPYNEYAIPTKPIENNDNAIKSLIKLIKEKNINEIIIGYPLLENNEISSICKIIDNFTEKLKDEIKKEGLDINFSYYNEYYTTKQAKSNIEVYDKKKKSWKLYKDSYAAQVILEDYLFNKNNKSKDNTS